MKQTHLPDKFYSGSITVVVVSAIMSVLVQLWLGFDISQFSHSLIGDRGDTVLNSAFLYQALDNLLHRPLHPGYMPMFYNEPNAFWYSIAPYGIAAVTLPVYLLSGENIVLTHNLYVIFSTVATAWIGFLLTYYLLPVSRFFAVLAGLMIAFATWRTGEIPHIETLSFQFPLLALYCLHRLIDTPRRRWAVGLALAFWLTMNTSGYLMWVFLMSGIVVMLYLLLRRRRFITRHFIALMMFAIVLATVISAPFIIGKWQNDVLRRGFGRDNINDISANPEEFLDSTALIYWKRLPGFGDQKLFIGFLPIIFSLAALWHYRRSSKTPESDHAFSTRDILILYAVIVVVGYVLMLGPDLTLSSGEDTHTLPYAALLNLPGFKSMRVPTRFYVMVITGTAILSAYGMQSFTARFQQKPRVYNVALMTLVLLLFLENVPMNNPGAEGNPLKAITIPREMRRMQGVYRPQDAAEVPAYAWLREQPPGTPIVHYPGSYFIVQNMLADQHLHGQPIFTGGGTFYPDYYWAIRWEIFPDMYVMHLLWQRDIRYLLVHRDLMNPDELSAFEARLAVFEREWIDLPYVGRFGEIDIYEVTAPEQIVIDFDDKTPVGEGWHTPQVDEQNRTFIWTGPEARSSLNLEPIPLSTDYRILVVVLDEGLEGLAYSMSIFVNGITIPLLRESNSETAYSGVIPGAALDSEIFQLDFAVPAVSADGRGLALDWLIIAPQPGIK